MTYAYVMVTAWSKSLDIITHSLLWSRNNYYLRFTDGETEHREVMKIVQSHKQLIKGRAGV